MTPPLRAEAALPSWLKALKEQLVLAEEYQAKRAAAAQVLEPQFPGWDETPAPNLTGTGGPKRVIWTTKDGLAKVWVTVRRDEDKPEWESQYDWDRRHREEHDERERCLRDAWLRDRLSQEVGDPPRTPDVATLRDEIARTEARLAALRDKAGKEHLPLEQAAGGTVKRSGADPKAKKAVYTEADLTPHVDKTVAVAPRQEKSCTLSSATTTTPSPGTSTRSGTTAAATSSVSASLVRATLSAIAKLSRSPRSRSSAAAATAP